MMCINYFKYYIFFSILVLPINYSCYYHNDFTGFNDCYLYSPPFGRIKILFLITVFNVHYVYLMYIEYINLYFEC